MVRSNIFDIFSDKLNQISKASLYDIRFLQQFKNPAIYCCRYRTVAWIIFLYFCPNLIGQTLAVTHFHKLDFL